MTESEALKLIVTATGLATQITALLPTLVANFQAIRNGLGETDADALNASIVEAHAQVQALDVQLAALRTPTAG